MRKILSYLGTNVYRPTLHSKLPAAAPRASKLTSSLRFTAKSTKNVNLPRDRQRTCYALSHERVVSRGWVLHGKNLGGTRRHPLQAGAEFLGLRPRFRWKHPRMGIDWFLVGQARSRLTPAAGQACGVSRFLSLEVTPRYWLGSGCNLGKWRRVHARIAKALSDPDRAPFPSSCGIVVTTSYRSNFTPLPPCCVPLGLFSFQSDARYGTMRPIDDHRTSERDKRS